VSEPQNQISWHQCPSGLFAQTFDTASIGSGAGVPLTMWARDAAYDYGTGQYMSAAVTRNVNLDNQPVSLSLSGPSDAPSTAGRQTITATATAGPSGVRGIWCSVDNAPYQFHAGASEQLQVQGIGQHSASCFATNNALDEAAQPARSQVQTWTLSIREPSVSAVSFAHVVNALRCSKRRETVKVPARWVTVTYHGHRQRIKVPAETKRVTVVHCHPRVVFRRVRVNGHWRMKRVVLLPHTVQVSTKHIAHGAPATISGWLGTAGGNALPGQRVTILTAPDTGRGMFTASAVATTGPDGSWTATLPPGPSRVVRAVYGGAGTVEPAISTDARIVVPASVSLAVSPHHTHWGRTIKIRGRLHGGYVPPSGEVVVLWIGWPGGSTEIGHLYARGDGRFSSRYTFLRGNGSETYHLWAASATETDYPFTTARSRSTPVTVSP
jgi:hypothetical protein